MGFSNLSIRKRIMPLVFAATAAVTFLPTQLVGQEKLQAGGGSAPALGAGNEPVVVVTIGSISKLMEDVNYLSAIGGQPQAGGMFQMMAATFTQGVDTTQPIGVMVPMVNGSPEPIAVIPTSDVKTVLKRLEAQTGPVDELEDGTLVIAMGANVVYIRQVGNWAVAARTPDVLAMAPADPTSLFEGMGNKYDLAFRVKMQQIPAETRDMLIAQMRQGFEQAMAQQNNGDADSARQMAEGTIDQLEMMIKESDEINFGWNVDQLNKQMIIDFSFTALQGTQLAAVYGGQQAIPSKFASVIRPDAAGYIHAAASISPEAVEMTRTSLNNSLTTLRGALANEDKLTPEQQAEINKMINRVADLYVDSVAEGKMDLGAMLLANEDDFRFVLGGFVTDGNEAAQIVKDLADKVQNETDAPRFKFDQGTYKGVTMHIVEADVPESEDEVRTIFGDVLRVHIGTGPKTVYVAVGKRSDDLLKQFIDSGAADTDSGNRPIGQMRFTLLPILQFAQSVEDNATIAAMINTLAGAPDPGEVNVISTAITNGAKSQIKIGEGLMKAIGTAAAQGQAQNAGGF
ncbi:MAG: hypothetical protein HKN47_07130 [Pirellulaceae bacterium]|nr:hypothetical protein [Pirellulaceae bacterium]